MNNKKLVWSAVIVIIVVLVVGVFVQGKDKSPSEQVKVGVIMPLTGGLAKTGVDAKIGLEIAQSDFPKTNISLVFEDDAFTPKESVAVFNKIAGMKDVVAVIGPLNGSSIESVRPLAVQNKLPLFTPWGAGNDMGDYVYKNSVEGGDEARIMADKANSLGYKKLAIIYLQNDFGLKYLNSFKVAVPNNGGSVVAEEPAPFGTTDFRTALTKIKAAKPDALYIVNTSVSVAEIAKQAAELGLHIPLLSQYSTESPDLIKIGGQSLEGMLYTFPINESALSEKQAKFISEFKKRTGDEPQIIAYNAYDIYVVISEAVEVCKIDRVCVNNYLSNIKGFDGVGGKFSIKDGKLVREFYFKTIKDGKFVSAE
jgi:branched-chain amino acid transport system substrate-binding protein